MALTKYVSLRNDKHILYFKKNILSLRGIDERYTKFLDYRELH